MSKFHFSQNSHFQNIIFRKIHIFKVSFFTKFTLSKSHFSQNSHFKSLVFHNYQIHTYKVSFLPKFTISKYHFSQNSHFFKHQILGYLWIKSWFFNPVRLVSLMTLSYIQFRSTVITFLNTIFLRDILIKFCSFPMTNNL